MNPFVHLEWQTFAIGSGVVWGNQSIPMDGDIESGFLPSVYLRVGNPRNFYFDISVFNDFPLVTSNYYNIGIGSAFNPSFEWWVGAGGGPYGKVGFVGKSYIRLWQPIDLSLFTRIGGNESLNENAYGIGLRYRYRKITRSLVLSQSLFVILSHQPNHTQ